MRYLIPILNILTTSLRPLLSISFPSSGPWSISRPLPSLQHIELSNETTLVTNITAGWLVRRGEPPSSGTLVYRIVPNNFIQLKPRESRTVGPKGERVIPPTRISGEIPVEVDSLTTAYLGLWTGVCTICFLLFLFSSLSGTWNFFIGATTLALLLLVDLILQAFFFVFDWSGLLIVWIDDAVTICFVAVLWALDSFCLLVDRLQEECKKREEENLLEHIKRAEPIPVGNFQRPSGQRSVPRLFHGQEDQFIHHLYLPEERDSPVRHMQDPRYFNHLRKIGAGAFGSIHLVENRITGKMMAMKTLLRRDNTNEEINLEIRALLRLQTHLWYPKVLSTFMDPNNIYILMPYYSRGDLYCVMHTSGGCLNRTLSTFYLAEILLALHGIHQAGIVHRDLKPENILFDDEGHVVIADFGVAQVFVADEEDEAFMEDEFPLWEERKQRGGDGFPLLTPSIDNPHTIKGIAGTPFYAAPEVLAGREYSYGIEYYSMAIVYHEMVTGYVPIVCTPYDGVSDPQDHITLDLGRKDVHFQPISASDLDFLSQMLDPDPYQRLSVTRMKEHLVFAGIDWEKLSRRELPVPPIHCPIRKRVPISPGVERCLEESLEDSVESSIAGRAQTGLYA